MCLDLEVKDSTAQRGPRQWKALITSSFIFTVAVDVWIFIYSSFGLSWSCHSQSKKLTNAGVLGESIRPSKGSAKWSQNDNDMDSMDHVKTLEEFDGHHKMKYNVSIGFISNWNLITASNFWCTWTEELPMFWWNLSSYMLPES